MPHRITPLDVQTFASEEVFRKGERLYEKHLVKNRFQTNFGLKATVRDKNSFHVEMIVDNEQLFGRCGCHEGNSPCEHQVATLLAWLNESPTFTSYQTLRKAIRLQEKNALVDILINLCEVFPDLSRLFIFTPGADENEVIKEDVDDVFDFPRDEKIKTQDILASLQILLIRAKIYRNEGKLDLTRLIYFYILNKILELMDEHRIYNSFPENIITDMADDYEEIALGDPEFKSREKRIKEEIVQLCHFNAAESEGVFLDQLKEKLGMV